MTDRFFFSFILIPRNRVDCLISDYVLIYFITLTILLRKSLCISRCDLTSRLKRFSTFREKVGHFCTCPLLMFSMMSRLEPPTDRMFCWSWWDSLRLPQLGVAQFSFSRPWKPAAFSMGFRGWTALEQQIPHWKPFGFCRWAVWYLVQHLAVAMSTFLCAKIFPC